MEYEELSVEEKVKIASNFLLSSPPGEINDVFADLNTLVGGDSTLREGLLAALKQYSTEQLSVTKLPEQPHQTIVCEAAHIGADRYIDPRANKTFVFDYATLKATKIEDASVDDQAPEEAYRMAIDDAVRGYVASHYPNGVASVFLNDKVITIAIVSNKYNSPSFWNGRWRSVWTFSLDTRELKGTIKVNVHYYEDGNVQLDSSKSVQTTIDDASTPDKLAANVANVIKTAESDYQRAINGGYVQLSENTFKSLRRTLPMTRKKLDWDKIANYRIGSELASK